MFLHELVISDRIIKFQRIAISWTAIISLVMVCACAGIVGARRQSSDSQSGQTEKPRATGVISISQTVLHISVYDKDGKLVEGLPRDAFHVYEDKVEQKIAEFDEKDEPLRIGLLVDTSGSVFQQERQTKDSVKRFVQAGNPEDKFFGATFADSVTPVATIQELLDSIDARGSTKMKDALYFGLVELEDTRNFRKALLIISDGGDNSSRHSQADLLKLVREAGVPIYALAGRDSRVTREQVAAGAHFLDELCRMSGGRFVNVKELTEMPELAAEIGTELRKQYMLGYYPSSGIQGPNDVRWRKLEVKVQAGGARGPLKVVAPEGYIATTR
jgi:Ca-activated chloride channel family protein